MVTLITSDGGAIRTITESHKNLVAIVMIMDGSDSDHSDNSPGELNIKAITIF